MASRLQILIECRLELFPRAVWSADGRQVYFEWKQYTDPTEENFGTYVVGRNGKGLRKLSDAEARRPSAGRAQGGWMDLNRSLDESYLYTAKELAFLWNVSREWVRRKFMSEMQFFSLHELHQLFHEPTDHHSYRTRRKQAENVHERVLRN